MGKADGPERVREAEARLWASLGIMPTEHRLRLSTLGLSVRVLEVGQGEPVLFVHGTSVAGPTWADLVVRLGGYRCLLLDRPGCGFSDPFLGGLDVADLPGVADRLVADVLDALDLGAADIVATSVGGYYAVRTAARHPDRVSRMILMGWTMGTPGATAPLWLRVAGLPGLARMAAALPATTGSVRAMLRPFGMQRALDEGRLSDEAIEWLVALYRGTDTLRNETVHGPRVMTLRHGWADRVIHTDGLLAAIRAPTCMIWGTDDPFGGPDAARDLAARIHDAELHLLGRTGHAPWLDEPDEVAALTMAFLNRPR